jgi:small subunit ribosomal protein S17
MRTKKGIITSTKQDKTLVVTIHSYRTHPKYKKRYLVSKKFYVHNPENKKFEIGEEIAFFESKPLSKLKRWTIVKPNNETKKI